DGGTRLVTWHYHDGEGWQSVKHHPTGVFSQVDCAPGVLWETVATLFLPVGSWLQRLDRFPSRDDKPVDPMEYLRRQVRQRRYDVRRSFFTVLPRGKLKRAAASQAPT